MRRDLLPRGHAPWALALRSGLLSSPVVLALLTAGGGAAAPAAASLPQRDTGSAARPSPTVSPGVFLGELTWPDAERRLAEAPVVVVPFGAGAKEHGPHLPMNADAVVARFLCERAVAELPVVVAPMIEHGWFPAFRDFPGTEVADPDVFRAYVMEVAMSLVRNGARRIAFLNTGIARATGLPLAIVAREIRVQTGVPTLLVSWDDLETEEARQLQESRVDGHAGEIETSIHLFLQPELVHLDAAVADTGDPDRPALLGYAPGLFSRDPHDPAHSESGVLGDPTLASADKGRDYLRVLADAFVASLRGFSETPLRSAGAR